MLGVAVIGLGEIGAVYAATLADPSARRLVAVCDTDRARLDAATARFGVRGYADVRSVLESDDVDVIAVCLPHHLHFPVASEAIAAGKHVLLEKPMATSVAECDALIAAAAMRGVNLGVSHNRLFVPSIVKAKELIASGTIGTPVLLRHRFGAHEPFQGWRADPAKSGGGLLTDCGVHALYVARHLFGEISRVRAILDVPHTEGENLGVAWLEFASGAGGLIEANYYGPRGMFDDSVEVITSEAVLRLGGLEAATFGYRTTEPRLERYQDRTWTIEPVADMDWAGSVGTSVRAFLDALETGRPVPTTGADGRESIRLLHEAYSAPMLVGRFTGAGVPGARPVATTA